MAQYIFWNGPMPTTAAQAVVTTGTAIKTLLQVKGVTGVQFKVKEWGISFDGSAAATPIKCELLETGTVFGTVTAAVAADLAKYDNPGNPTSTTFFSVGTTATGYTCTSEGSITATRVFDAQLVAPTGGYLKQYPLGQEPCVDAVSALRIRVTAGAAVNAVCYVICEV
jgi:hypothetical protein